MQQAVPRPPVNTPFFYGYLVAAVCFLAMSFSVGMGFYSFSVFMGPLMQEFNWSAAEVSTAISFNIASGFIAPLVGMLIDRWGPRKTMLVFTPIVGISYFLRAGMTDLWQLYAIQVLSAIGQSGETGIAIGLVMSTWFKRKRGRMMGLTMMGANVGGIVVSPLTNLLIEAVGWRMTYVVFGLLVMLVLVPILYLVLRNTPEDVGLTADGLPDSAPVPAAMAAEHANAAEWTAGQALRTLAYWAVAIGLGAGIVGMTGVLQMEVLYLTSIGFDSSSAAYALSATAFFGMMGKVLFGFMAEKSPARFAVMLALLYEAAGVALLLNVRQPFDLIFFAPAFGLGFGAIGALQPLIVGQTFGLRSFGTVFGTVQVATSAAAAIAPPLAGFIRDSTGSYAAAFVIFTVLLLLGAASVFFARPPRPAAAAAPSLGNVPQPERVG